MLDDIVSQYSGTAQQITDTLNTDEVTWSPVSIAALNALCDTLDVTLWLNATYASTTDATVKRACASALGLFNAKYENLDLQDPEIRAKVVGILDTLSQVPGSVLTPAVVERIYNLGRRIVNRAKDVNNGNLLNVAQTQAALDRNARRVELKAWFDSAYKRINTESPTPTLAQLLTVVGG